MKLARVGFLIAVTIAFGFATLAQEVHTDYDKKATFEKYRTYSWGRVQTSNPLWQSRIEDAVDRQLKARGWERVENGGDAVLAAVGATHNEREYRTFYDGMGGWRWHGFGTTTTTVENYRVGTLIVDIYDAGDKGLIFRGTATDTLSDKPEHNEKKLDEAAEKMFKKFPPK